MLYFERIFIQLSHYEFLKNPSGWFCKTDEVFSLNFSPLKIKKINSMADYRENQSTCFKLI